MATDPLAVTAADPIKDQFSKIHDMFAAGPVSGPLPTAPGGGNTQTGALATEPIADNSLTQFIRSLTNYQGAAGEQAMGVGSSMLGLGSDILGKGMETFAAPTDYYSRILSGDPSAMAEVMNPEARVINANYNNALKQARMNLPRSGYASQQQSELPFQKAGALTGVLQTVRPQAATALTGIAQAISGIGQGEQGLAEGEQGIATQLLSNTAQQLLTRRGQNINQDAQAMKALSDLGLGLGKLLAGLGWIPTGPFNKTPTTDTNTPPGMNYPGTSGGTSTPSLDMPPDLAYDPSQWGPYPWQPSGPGSLPTTDTWAGQVPSMTFGPGQGQGQTLGDTGYPDVGGFYGDTGFTP